MARMTRAILRTTSAVSSSADDPLDGALGHLVDHLPEDPGAVGQHDHAGDHRVRSFGALKRGADRGHHLALRSAVALAEPRRGDHAEHVAGSSLQQIRLDQCVEDLGAQLPGAQLHDPGADAALAGRLHDETQHLVEHRVPGGLVGEHPDPVAAVQVDLDPAGDAEVGEHGARHGVVHEALRPQVPARDVTRRHQRVGLGDVQPVRSRATSEHRASSMPGAAQGPNSTCSDPRAPPV